MAGPPPPDRPSAKRLPRGRHGLPRAAVVSNQRERIIDSVVHVCATKGYPAVTVEDITSYAGVSRRTFYDLFTDKEQCFLAAYDQIAERLLKEVGSAFAIGDAAWPERVASALRVLAALLAAEPCLARFMIVEVLAAGRPALDRRDQALTRFEAFFETGRLGLPEGMDGQALIAQAVVGGLYEALYSQILDGDVGLLPELVPDLVYCALVPYLGHRRAMASSRSERERRARFVTEERAKQDPAASEQAILGAD
jgi:AcrR family transcriptional regulator